MKNCDETAVNYLINTFELQHPLPSGYTRSLRIIAHKREMYQKLANESAKQLLRPFSTENMHEVANVKYGAIFMGFGYYIGAIISNGKAIAITHQLRYEDTPVWTYDASKILNIDAENFCYSQGLTTEDVEKMTAEEIQNIETGLLLNWYVNPRGNEEIVNEVFKKICPPMVREISSRMSGNSKKEIVLYVPPIAPSLEINWETVFDGLTLENTSIHIHDTGVLFTPNKNERLYKIYKHAWEFGNCFILQAAETINDQETISLGSSACVQDEFEHYYQLRPSPEKFYPLHGSKPVGNYSLPTVNETKYTYCDQFVESKYPTHEGTFSYLGSSAPLFYYDFYSLTGTGVPTRHFEINVANAFMGKTQQMKSICSKLCNENDLQNISLGDMVAVGLALENSSVFRNTTISTKKEKLDMNTKRGLLPDIDIAQLVSLPSNYAEFTWKTREKIDDEDYRLMDYQVLRSKSLDVQLVLILSCLDSETTEGLAEEVLYIHGIRSLPTALFVARLFSYLCNHKEFVAGKSSAIIQEFEVSSIFAQEVPAPRISNTSKQHDTWKKTDAKPQQVLSKSVNKYVNLPIEEIGFSIRTYNCLKRARKSTVQDLTGMTESDYQKIRNLGAKSTLEIKEKLKTLGLSFKK